MRKKPIGSTVTRRQFHTALICTTATFLVLLFAFSASLYSFGWFSQNEGIGATGRTVSVKSPPNLIISDNRSDVTNRQTVDENLFEVNFTSALEELEPAMHDNATHSLVVIADKDNINPLTGMAKVSDTFTYTAATENVHYVDFVTYLGTSGDALNYTNLTVKFDTEACYAECAEGETVQSGVTYYSRSGSDFTEEALAEGDSAEGMFTRVFDGIYLTASVDVFYRDTFVATLHPSNLGTVAGELRLSPSGTIQPSDPVKVLLRVYFDGSMVAPGDETGKTILRAGNQSLNGIYLGFAFTVEGTAE